MALLCQVIGDAILKFKSCVVAANVDVHSDILSKD
jgi:hypothetical protein